MRPELARRATALCLALLGSGLLVACGADDESPVASSTTAAAAATTAVTTTTATTAQQSTSDAGAGAGAGTPGVGDPDASSPGAVAGDRSCQSPVGLRADPTAVGDVEAATVAADGAGAATDPQSTTARDVAARTAADQAALPRPFSNGSPWNTAIDTRAVDARSDAWIARASRRVGVVAAADGQSVDTTQRLARARGLYVNTCAWTPAIVGEAGGRTVRIVCRQRNCGPVAKEVKTLRIASGVEPFPQFDGWYSVIDVSAGVAYDLWRARRVGDVISYQFIKRWLLDGPGFSPPATEDPVGAVGARGSGLPLFAGVIQPDELRRGRIEHALAISVPGPAQRVFVRPASVTNGINVIDSLPEGARLRLKSTYATLRLPRGANRRSAEAVITALRTYGAIVVDRSIAPTLYARRSSNYGTLLIGNELQGIRLTDLEVVQAGPLQRFPPLDSTQEEVEG